MRHSISEINIEFATATCSICGINTPLKPNYRGGFRCRNKFNEQRNLGRATGTHTRKQYQIEKKYDGVVRSEIVAKLLPAQNGRCAICKEFFTGTPNVDHDHQTGVVRGLLCHGCNVGIGFLKDDIRLLKSAIVYLSV